MLSIAVGVCFVRTCLIHTDVIGLFLAHFGQHCADFLEVQTGHFFVEVLWQNVNFSDFVIGLFGEQLDLRQHLIGKAR